MSSFYNKVAEILSSGEKLAMASITTQKGSSPRSRGARCAIREDGSIIGTIGGGLLEASAQEAGLMSLRDGKLRYVEMDLSSDKLAGNEMICGGSLEFMVVPWGAPEEQLARTLASASSGNTEGVLLTRWEPGSGKARVEFVESGEVDGDQALPKQLDNLLKQAVTTDKTAVQIDADEGAAIELVRREELELVILGGGHVGRALGALASLAGFTVTVVDDREEFASRQAHPDVNEVLCTPFESYLATSSADSHTFIVIVTRGHKTDTTCALGSLKGSAGYVGMIGSRRKGKIIIDHLKEMGVSEKRLQDFHTPIGLSIGAQTPEEIAVSILAEMIKVRRERAL